MRLWRLIRWIEESDEKKMYKGLPRGCWHCEVLGLCRRPKEEGWKCYDGCRIIKEKRRIRKNGEMETNSNLRDDKKSD